MNESSMLIGLAAALFVCCEVGYSCYHFYRKQQMKYWALGEDGEQLNTFTDGELAFIKQESAKQGAFLIDDITWNDLAMDQIYQAMNNCLSSAGDQCLYHFLRNPLLDEQAVKKRRERAELLWQKETQRKLLRAQFYRIGGQCERPLDEVYHIDQTTFHVPVKLIYCLLAVTLISIISALIAPALFLLPAVMLIIDYMLCNKLRDRYIYVYLSAQYLYRYAQAIQSIGELPIAPEIRAYYHFDELVNSLSTLKHSMFADFFEGDGLLLLLGKNFFFLELLSFHRLATSLFKHEKAVREAVHVVGELEALMAATCYIHRKPVFCNAAFQHDGKMHVKGMCHPLLKQSVPNDLFAQKNLLISGSNASGKSTYLKMTAINAIFAQSFGYAFAQQYKADLFQICTSMSLQDSIEQKESYFMAELRSIKRMLDHSKQDVPLLCMIDEILRGTNTGERIAAASAILAKFVQPQILCIAATHDLELTVILSNHYQNMHFSEELNQYAMCFSYQIQEGPSNSHNALPLLQNLGFSDAIIKNAQHLRNTYEQEGRWSWKEEGTVQ